MHDAESSSSPACTSPSQVRVPNARVRVESESFSARVQVKSRVSKFSSRVGLESESRTRVLQHWLKVIHSAFILQHTTRSMLCVSENKAGFQTLIVFYSEFLQSDFSRYHSRWWRLLPF